MLDWDTNDDNGVIGIIALIDLTSAASGSWHASRNVVKNCP